MYYLVNVAYLIFLQKSQPKQLSFQIKFLKSEEWPHLCLVFANNIPLTIANSII